MAIRDVIGQERALRILIGTLIRDRVPSAFLFSGDAGIGKRFAAINYVKAINCLHPIDFDCCDSCISCKKIDADMHPDVLNITLENVEEKLSLEKKENIRSEYPIDAIRKIEEFLYYSTNEGRKKVVIIDDADAMNTYSANAFLKTLEEPTRESLILLISNKPDIMLDTIRSRCINVKFYPLPVNDSKKIIEKFISDKEKDIEFLIKIAMGRPGLALSKDFIEEREQFIKLFKKMLSIDNKDIWTDKSEIKTWIDMAIIFLRDLAVCLEFGDCSEKSLIMNVKLQEIKKDKALNIKTILDAYMDMQKVREMLDYNLNKAITWNHIASRMRELNLTMNL